ncbi:hypothetical protein RFI_09009 [Reticulomyxa filosa]|uniref:Uncharacterized protein n=1 Tax=Reticulomyxa filosa TaxID=46433 RepID=X6NQ20_RETFI|nr:hypothetical protein RFI_09009 [Reticulomyxa filosa]|eukprot:ETO28121.1 hypothetical protein RFI_09009 [Reticulomyxa filosa]
MYKKIQQERREQERKERETRTGRKEEKMPENNENEKNERKIIDCKSKAVVSNLRPYIDLRILRQFQAETEITSGNEKTNAEAYSVLAEMRGTSYLNTWKDEVLLEFDKDNEKNLTVKDSVTIRLCVKNVKKVLVKAFGIQTMQYYTKELKEVATDLNLEGLQSAYKDREIAVDNFTTPFHIRHLEITFEELANSRGVFFIDCIGNGKHCRAVIRKGNMKCVERKSSSGHIFKLFDENNQVIKNGGIVVDGIRYETHKDTHEICVPYNKKSGAVDQKKKIILYNKDWNIETTCVLSEFTHICERYQLNTSIFVEREQMLDKNTCDILIRNQLFVNGVVTSAKELLKEVSLDVNFDTKDGVPARKMFKGLEIHDNKDCIVKAVIPNETNSLRMEFKAQIVKSDGSVENVSKSQQYVINSINKVNDAIIEMHLMPQQDKNHYKIWITGKNGESIPHIKCSVYFRHYLYKDEIYVEAQSDENGFIDVQDASGVSHIRVQVAGVNQGAEWSLCTDQCLNLNNYYVLESQNFIFPISFLEELKTFDCCCGTRITRMITATKCYQLSETTPLQLAHVDETDGRIYLKGVNEKWTRVHVYSTHLIPGFPVFNEIRNIAARESDVSSYSTNPSMYCRPRDISEEYRYVLERATAYKCIGNNLQKPSLLIRPFSGQIERKSYNDTVTQSAGSTVVSKAEALRSNGQWPVLEFLGNFPGTGVYNLVCRKDEKAKDLWYVQLPKDFVNENHNVWTIVAMDDKQYSTAMHVLNNKSKQYKYQDGRMFPGLDPSKHFMEKREIELLRDAKSDKVVIHDFKVSQGEVFDSIESLFGLFKTLSSNKGLDEWSFLYEWQTYELSQKLKKWNKYMCHEFNFFMYCKDRPFFEEYIKPLLQSKVHKTFIDEWLLGDAKVLEKYLNMGKFMKLNILEQILLCFACKKQLPSELSGAFKDKHDALKPLDPLTWKRLA